MCFVLCMLCSISCCLFAFCCFRLSFVVCCLMRYARCSLLFVGVRVCCSFCSSSLAHCLQLVVRGISFVSCFFVIVCCCSLFVVCCLLLVVCGLSFFYVYI